MKKLLLSLFLFSAVSLTHAQGFSIGLGGGLSLIQNDAYESFDMANEYHFGVKGKLSVLLLPITPVGFVNYYLLTGESASVEYTQSILSLGVGGELSLVPGPLPLKPYLAAEIAFNTLGAFEAKSPTGTVTTPSASRVGLGIGAGAEITVLPIDLDVSVKYQLLNLIGKEDGEESVNSINLSLHLLFSAI